jgi:heterodisulfide reductase subunit A
VEFYQPLMGEVRSLPFDLVVLSTPLVARADAPALSQLMRLPIDQNQFFLEAHAKLRPLDFATDGIFVAGSARYPATFWEARAQGLGSASRAGTVLFKEKLITSPLVAEINEATCVGCQGCLGMCPYGAIDFVKGKGVCKVNTILCKGCGNCASTCPSQSVQLKGFTAKQLLSQIRSTMG